MSYISDFTVTGDEDGGRVRMAATKKEKRAEPCLAKNSLFLIFN